jgi:hypothetical protein
MIKFIIKIFKIKFTIKDNDIIKKLKITKKLIFSNKIPNKYSFKRLLGRYINSKCSNHKLIFLN